AGTADPAVRIEQGDRRILSPADTRQTAEHSCTGRALVVHPTPKSPSWRRPADLAGRSVEARLGEAVGLARAIRLHVVGAEITPVARPRPSSLLGSGTLDTLGGLISDNEVGVVV